MIQGTPVNIIVGSHVWTEDPEVAWIDGEVIEIKGKNVTVVTTNGRTVRDSYQSLYSIAAIYMCAIYMCVCARARNY